MKLKKAVIESNVYTNSKQTRYSSTLNKSFGRNFWRGQDVIYLDKIILRNNLKFKTKATY